MPGGPQAEERAGTAGDPLRSFRVAAWLLLAACLLPAAVGPLDVALLRTAQADAPPPPPPPPGESAPSAGAGSTPAPRPVPRAAVPSPPPPPPSTWGPRTRAPAPAGGRLRVPPPPPPPAWPATPRSTTRRQPSAVPRPPAAGSARPAPPAPAAPVPASPAPPGPAPSGDEERPRIVRIEFDGNLLYGSEMIKTRLRNKEGRRLDPVALDADMKELYRYFKEIQVVKEPVPGGIVLRFLVSENPLVVRLDIRGATEMEDAEIKGMLRTKEGFPLSPYQLAADREDVEEAYRLRGFHFVHVPEPQVVALPSGGRRVVFAIVEGPQVQVSRIVFRGNTSIPRSDLTEVMLTEDANFIEQIIGENTFREDVLREDLVAIKQLYRREGFLDAEVALDDLRFSDDKSRVEVSIAITEHRPYVLGGITFDIRREDPGRVGSPTPEDIAYFTEERLAQLLAVRSGTRFSGKAIDEGLEKIKEAYYARSYVDAHVGPAHLRGRERQTIVDVEIVVHEGAKYRLARIDFVGNEFTRDKILRREVHTSPGGYIDRNQLDRGLTRIQRTTYFDRATMRIDDMIGPDGEPLEGWKRATYELVEGSTGQFTFGVSVSTNGGFAASIQFQKRNFDIARPPTSFDDISSGRAFTGAGQEFDILIVPSTEVSQIRVRFREPRLFGSKLGFETSVYKNFEFRRSYVVDRTGYSVALSYPLYVNPEETQALVARVGWRHELDDVVSVSANSIPGAFLFNPEAELRGLSGTLTFRTVDDFLDPRHDTSTAVSAEVVGTFLGGDVDFWALTASHSQSHVLHVDDEGKKQRLSGRVSMGIAEALEDTPEVPPYERFYLGGRNLRAFRFRGVGPHVNGFPTGGEWMLSGSLEYEYPLVRKLLSVVAFVDAGTLGTSVNEADAFRMRLGIGAGLRFAIPFLLGERPLALDFGIPVFSEDEDEESVVSFSLGRNF